MQNEEHVIHVSGMTIHGYLILAITFLHTVNSKSFFISFHHMI